MAKSQRGKEYKVILLGASGVGKGKLFRTFCQINQSDPSAPSSVTGKVDKKARSFLASTENGPNGPSPRHMELELWHPAGLERFRSLTKSYFRGTKIVILCYNQRSESSVREFAKYVVDLDYIKSNEKEFSPMIYFCALDTEGSTETSREVQSQLEKLEHDLQLKKCPVEKKGFCINPFSRIEVDNMMTSLASKLKEKDVWNRSRSRSTLNVTTPKTESKKRCCIIL